MPKSKTRPELQAPAPAGSFTQEQALSFLNNCLNIKTPVPADIIAELRKTLDAHPLLWRVAGNVSYQTRQRMIGAFWPNEAARMIISRGAADLADRLGKQEAGALEKLLIDQVVLCWINFHYVQERYAGGVVGAISFDAGTYWERKLGQAQKRYLRAMETLARVRKMAHHNGPLQLNIGGQQLNLAVGATLAEPTEQPDQVVDAAARPG